MEMKKLGVITEEERDTIMSLNNKRDAIHELLITLAKVDLPKGEANELYNRLVSDNEMVMLNIKSWWKSMVEKYGWKPIENAQWHLDFNTCEVSLISIST